MRYSASECVICAISGFNAICDHKITTCLKII